jgi:hypothetical protein
MDLDKIEKEIMRKKEEKGSKRTENDPVKLYNQELNQLAEDLGIELIDDDMQINKSGPVNNNINIKPINLNYYDKKNDYHKHDNHHKQDSRHKHDKYTDSEESYSESGSSRSSRSSKSSRSSRSSRSYSDSDSGSYSDESGSYTDDSRSSRSSGSSRSSRSSRSSKSSTSSKSHKSHRSHRSHRSSKKYSNHLEPISEDRKYINNVVSTIRNESFTVIGEEREKIRDSKASKLEQIGQLRLTLEDEGIDCSSVTKPNMDSPMDEIDAVINILRLKNDRNRYSTIAEEVILGIAEGIETVFDGSRRIPILGWRPDYTGYHNTVNVKLHRMRFETSQVVGSIIEKHKIGSSARIALELLPSFLLYPRQQKIQKKMPGLHDDNKINDARGAFNAIRKSEERQSLYDDLDNV